MPRANRVDIANQIYHVINRANARLPIFETEKDFQLFEKVLEEAKNRIDVDIYSYCLMPNHWHFVISPKKDGELAKFMAWLTMTHTQRWHSQHKSVGTGHLYQGRYKSFIVEKEKYLWQLCRYVERNPLRANLAKEAKDWTWSSYWRRELGNEKQKKLLSAWPVQMPEDYKQWLEAKENDEELQTIRHCVNKGKPFGSFDWIAKMVDTFKLKSTLSNPGRPRKGS